MAAVRPMHLILLILSLSKHDGPDLAGGIVPCGGVANQVDVSDMFSRRPPLPEFRHALGQTDTECTSEQPEEQVAYV
jgi:hypothetical protein